MTTAAVIQARMGSTRLPGKVLRELGGRPMLEQVIRRVRGASRLDAVAVATTTLDRDDPVAELASRLGVAVVRGSEEDVLDRYATAVRELGASLVVRITSDCPLIDPALIDEMLLARERHVTETGPVHVYSNILERTYPRGLDTEIVPGEVLVELAGRATDPRAREHVTWQLYREPDRYRAVNHAQPGGRDDSRHRWTVDTAEDYELVRRMYDALSEPFGMREVLCLLEAHPDWVAINAHVEQKRV